MKTTHVMFETEKTLAALELDIRLVHQYFASLGRKELEPEKKLMFAVSEDAVACFRRSLFARAARERELLEETEVWLWGKNSESPFSFQNICEMLGFDPGYVQKHLLHWKERQLAKGHPSEVASAPKSRRGISNAYRTKTRRRCPAHSRQKAQSPC